MVSVINRSMFPVQNSIHLIDQMQNQFQTLQQQLATGQKATDLAGLGSDRYFDLSLRSRMSRIDGYSDSITMVNSRLDMMNQLVSQLDTVEGDARASMSVSSYGTDDINFGSVPDNARNNLDQVINVLNQDMNGRYMFSGAATDQQPVETTDTILNGANGKAGFKQVAMERLQADEGADGLGRVTIGGTGGDTTLTEDAGPFGFKLASVTANSSAVTLTQPSGTAPQSLDVQFTGVPTAGDTVTLNMTLPDGTADSMTLKAVTGTPGAGEFQIGADAATTAANFKTSLQSSLSMEGSTTLVAASNNAAANNFFNGQGQAVQRVPGPDFAHATSLVNADPTTTVMWYKGADSADARASVSAKVDDTQTVSYGAQANESGVVNMVRGLAVMAIQNFSTSDPTSEARFDAVADRNLDRLSEDHNSEPGSIELMGVELGNAQASVKDVSTRHSNYTSQLQGLLDGVETVQPEDVAAQILALQTRLQASYQTTSMVAQMSLVNYLK